MDPEPPLLQFILFYYNPETTSASILIYIIIFLLLLIINTLTSASETAIFALSEKEIKDIEKTNSTKAQTISELKKKPRKLAVNILVLTTFINILLIVIGDHIIRLLLGIDAVNNIGNWLNNYVFNNYFDPVSIGSGVIFLISILSITFILALFGTLLPVKHGLAHKTGIVSFMARPLSFLNILCYPLNNILVRISQATEHKLSGSHNYHMTSKEDIDTAIDLAVTKNSESSVQEADILKGIVNFGDTSAKQIMRSRMDIIGFDIDSTFDEVMQVVRESGYSRLPVFKEDLDHIKGILYVKDLLAYTEEGKDFQWQSLIRNSVFFVPESKKIDELLREFQFKRMHMAIIVDEYGGTAGIATLEDIMEEVVGDIKDEFDIDEKTDYVKIDDNHYIFEGKTLLNDVCRVIGESTNFFDEVRGEADSIGGLILEMTGMIPHSNQEISINHIRLKVISATKRRIEKVSLQIYENF